jgi:hypothetical protein
LVEAESQGELDVGDASDDLGPAEFIGSPESL